MGRSERTPAGLLVAVVVALALPGAASATPAGSQEATSGATSVRLSWKGSPESYGGVTAPRLRIKRAWVVALDAGIGDLCRRCFFDGDAAEPDVELADLDGDAEPEVLVSAYTGGAHCCTDVGIWDFRVTRGTYGHLVRGFGNAGYVLEDLDGDGGAELSSVDDRFAYAFAPYVFSVRPVQVLRWSRTPTAHLSDVTRRFPKPVLEQAAELRRVLRGRSKDVDLRGPLAAYVADMYLLGRGSEGRREIARVRRRGRLGAAKDRVWPGGSRFEPALLEFLHKTGYR